MPRISTDEQLTELVANVITAITKSSPDAPLTKEAVDAFLEARLTGYDEASKTDTHLKTKAGKTYLPFPFNNGFIRQLRAAYEDANDPYDF